MSDNTTNRGSPSRGNLPYVKFWISDFKAATYHLSAAESGIWLTLTIECIQRGGFLPDSDRTLAKVARVSRYTWLEKYREAVLEDCFVLSDPGWTNDFALKAVADFERRRAQTAKARGANPRNTPELRLVPSPNPLPPDPTAGIHDSESPPPGGELYAGAYSLQTVPKTNCNSSDSEASVTVQKGNCNSSDAEAPVTAKKRSKSRASKTPGGRYE